jgi:hypothetical protein
LLGSDAGDGGTGGSAGGTGTAGGTSGGGPAGPAGRGSASFDEAPGSDGSSGTGGSRGSSRDGGLLGSPSSMPKDIRRAPPRPARQLSNRDWIIPVECTADAVVLPTVGKSFTLKELAAARPNASPLLQTVSELIDRRQATVRKGELEYHPQIRFVVAPDGFRAYYLAYPALEYLRIPMLKEQKQPTEEQ